MASTATRPFWCGLVLGVLLTASAVLGAALGLMDGESGVSGARLLLAALRLG
jgi:hypothetical protein